MAVRALASLRPRRVHVLMPEDGTEKLQKVLARRGLGSRRELEGWISQGRVSVNGKLATLGDRVRPSDLIRVDGRRVNSQALAATPRSRRVLRYHKPVGELCARSDPEDRPTVFERLPPRRHGRWIAVGRLDVNTSGLLLFTDDGDLAHRLMHPSHEIEREYAVRVFGEVPPEALESMRRGVDINGEHYRFERLVDAGGDGRNHWYHVTLRQGRNREVRRVWEAQGVAVSRLIRVGFGPVSLGRKLRPGQSEELPIEEANRLAAAVGLPAASAKRRQVLSSRGRPKPGGRTRRARAV